MITPDRVRIEISNYHDDDFVRYMWSAKATAGKQTLEMKFADWEMYSGPGGAFEQLDDALAEWGSK
jgi:hypothetical protein